MATKKKSAPKEIIKKPVSKHTAQPLAEAVTPKAEVVNESTVPCKDCRHGGAAHYGSSNRWCNLSGCQCQAYK